MHRTASFDILSVKIGLTDSPVGEFKNQRSVVNFEQEGCIFHLYGSYMGAKTPGQTEHKFFLAVCVNGVIKPFKFQIWCRSVQGFWVG